MPWPKGTHTLFNPPKDFRRAAFFDSGRGTPHGRIEGYKLSAEVLFERMMNARSDRDFLVYPYANNWRHSIELQLKELLALLVYLYDEKAPEDIEGTHNLALLWSKVSPLLQKAFPDERPMLSKTVTRVVGQMTSLDPDGQDFRYSVRTDGSPALQGRESIDLAEFHEALQGVSSFLDGGTMGVSELCETKRDLEREYGL